MEGKEPENFRQRRETAKRLREIADAIEYGLSVTVQINGRRVTVPKWAQFEIDLETKPSRNEVGIDMRWDHYRNQ